MAEQKLYIGSVGPFLYDDDAPIDDVDGDFAGKDYNALVTNGQLLVEGAPTDPNHITRLQDLAGLNGYCINVQALVSGPVDGDTVYFGILPKAPVVTANISKIYIRKAGTIKIAEIYCYSGTAGTNEDWSLYIRKNNLTDTLIATISISANERIFSNVALNIVVAVGDYIEIKSVQPTWATNPETTIYGGYVYIET